jgi:aryl-alcohol dehydrogenase-like predicted oxidoreductase
LPELLNINGHLLDTMRTENYLYVIGASKPSQIESNVDALYNLNFTKEELEQIDKNLK